MTGLREKVARANQDAWDNWPGPITHENLRDVRLAAADAAIAVCMEEAAPLVEQAFRHGIGYAQNVKVDDVDLAWETSRVRAALRALREGGVDEPDA